MPDTPKNQKKSPRFPQKVQVAGRLLEDALANLAEHTIGCRPGRVGPRALKRRPKPHELLTKPRDQARAALLGVKPS